MFGLSNPMLSMATETNPLKVHITAYQPYSGFGGGSYALSYVKQISTSSDFDSMPEEKRGCQNKESVEECTGKRLHQAGMDQCQCIPWALYGIDSEEKVGLPSHNSICVTQ